MAKAQAAAVFALLTLLVASVQAQNPTGGAKADFKGTLEKNGYKLAAALFDIAGLTGPLSNPAAVYTVLVPNDAAIQAFLQRMRLSVDDLKKRPLLAKQLAAQHLITGANVRSQEIFDNGPARVVETQAGKPNELLFRRLADGAVKVSDVHGQHANVKKYFTIDDNKTAHPVDKVLMPDTVFFTFHQLCTFRALTLRDFCNAVQYAGLNSTVNAENFNATVFVPNNQAFTKAIKLAGGSAPTVARTGEILRYHVLPGYQTLGSKLPTSIKNNAAVQTLLPGQTLTVDYQRVTPAAGSTRTLPHAKVTVKSGSGNQAEVLVANVHVGRALAHGINAVLMPGSGATASRPTTATTAASSSTRSTGRKLAATRNLLDYGWGFDGGPTAEMDDAESQIDAAADGNESVATAADRSLLGAEELSVPGDYDQVDNGVNPW